MVVLRAAQNPVKGGSQKDQENRAQLRLGPIVIRFSTSDTYPTKNRKKRQKTRITKVGRLSYWTLEIGVTPS